MAHTHPVDDCHPRHGAGQGRPWRASPIDRLRPWRSLRPLRRPRDQWLDQLPEPIGHKAVGGVIHCCLRRGSGHDRHRPAPSRGRLHRGAEFALSVLATLEQVLPTKLRRRVSALTSALRHLPGNGGVSSAVLTDLAPACGDRERVRLAYLPAGWRGDWRCDVSPAVWVTRQRAGAGRRSLFGGPPPGCGRRRRPSSRGRWRGR